MDSAPSLLLVSLAVFDTAVPAGVSVVEETLPDGRTITHRHIRSSPSRGDMEEITEEGPERETVEFKEESEILPDGTVHSTQRISHQKLKHIKRSLTSQSGEEEVYEEEQTIPGKQEVIQMFEQPPKLVQESDEIEQVLEDGTRVKKQVVMNRMVHLIKMHHESFDEEGRKTEEEYEIEEVIPGTESAFVAGVDSDYEEEMERKRTASMGEVEQVMDDGTVVTHGVLTSETTTRVRSRSGSIEETMETALVTEERVSPSPGRVSPQPVEFVHDTAGKMDDDMYDYSGKTVVQTTLRSGHLEETASHGVVETTFDVVEDMIAKGQLSLEETEGNAPA